MECARVQSLGYRRLVAKQQSSASATLRARLTHEQCIGLTSRSQFLARASSRNVGVPFEKCSVHAIWGRRARSLRAAYRIVCARVGREMENVGFQVRSLRQCLLSQQSPPPERRLRKPNIRGLFASDLLTGFAASGAIWLSLRPILSKAVDCRI